MARKALILLTCSLLFLPVLAGAADICWIDKITKAVGGVEVHFIAHANLGVLGKGAPNVYVSDGVVRQSTNNAETHLLLVQGQSVLVSVIPEDMCSITAITQDGQLGVLAHAANNMGGQHVVVSDFYPAE
jgi:hypothetical protein